MIKVYKIVSGVLMISLAALITGIFVLGDREELPGFMGILLLLCLLSGLVFIIGSIILFGFEVKARWKERKKYAIYELLKEIVVVSAAVGVMEVVIVRDEFQIGQIIVIALIVAVSGRAMSYMREVEKRV